MQQPTVLIAGALMCLGLSSCQSPNQLQYKKTTPIMVYFLPSDGWQFDTLPTEIELGLRGPIERTRPIADVAEFVGLRNVRSDQSWELERGSEYDNGAYSGSHFKTYVLPTELPDAEYELTARFHSWGEKLVSAETPGETPVDPTGVDWTSTFTINHTSFLIDSVAVCPESDLYRLALTTTLPLNLESVDDFKNHVQILGADQEAPCELAPESINDGMVGGRLGTFWNCTQPPARPIGFVLSAPLESGKLFAASYSAPAIPLTQIKTSGDGSTDSSGCTTWVRP